MVTTSAVKQIVPCNFQFEIQCKSACNFVSSCKLAFIISLSEESIEFMYDRAHRDRFNHKICRFLLFPRGKC